MHWYVIHKTRFHWGGKFSTGCENDSVQLVGFLVVWGTLGFAMGFILVNDMLVVFSVGFGVGVMFGRCFLLVGFLFLFPRNPVL